MVLKGGYSGIQSLWEHALDLGLPLPRIHNPCHDRPMSTPTIESILQEKRLFHPPAAFSQKAHIQSLQQYEELYARAKADPQAFWAELAQQELDWFQPWDTVLDWQPPFVKWFTGGKINISHNCLDRHLTSERRDKSALIWEGEPGDSRTLTYAQLHQEVCQFANALKQLGVQKGDVVGIYMPMIPEAAIAMLACARIGAPHTVVFGGFSAEALRDRLNDGKAKVVVTADGGWRKDAIVPLKNQVDKALADQAAPTVEKVLVVQRTQQDIAMEPERDYWWHELQATVSADCPPEPMDSEDVLFILYTSGSTGKPKGVVHTTAGYNLYTHITTKWIFDLKDTDIYWCTADVGWITGHSYIVYGPLSNGATTLMYEGAPRPSNPGCFWDVVEKYGVTIFYTAPTAIRAFIKMGENLPNARDLSSLRLLGTVGEPINPEAWMWYHRVIGQERCPIVDTWWQTETGGIMITALPGAIPTKPGSATLPFPGILADVVDLEGNPVGDNEGGYLVVRHPWPSMLRTVYGDDDRFRRTYWEHIPPKDGQYLYFAGDGARRDEDGYFWVMGRVDDVISVSGHRLGTMEIESALVSHPAVAEAAVVGKPDPLKGEEIVAFITLEGTYQASEDLAKELKQHVVAEIGALARPGEIRFSEALPKTRSGKIMRRLLRSLAAGQEVSGDTSTLEDRSVLDKLRSGS
jgi:acetyl-CoA synthetase